MPPSKIPIRSNKIILDSTPKQSPLECVRQEFQRRRSLEKLRIRAINGVDMGQRRVTLAKNNIFDDIYTNYIKPNRNYTSSNHVERPLEVDLRNGDNQFSHHEKRSAGRDRSHPLMALRDRQLEKKRTGIVADIKQMEETDHDQNMRDMNDANRTSNLSQVNSNVVRNPQKLPPVGRPSVHSAHSNFPNIFKLNEERDESNSSDGSERSKAGRFASASEMYRRNIVEQPPNLHQDFKVKKQRSESSDSSNNVSDMNSPISTTDIPNASVSSTSANEDQVPPSRERLANESQSGKVRRYQAKQKILEQQKLKMMKGSLGNVIDNRPTGSGSTVTPDNEDFSRSHFRHDKLVQIKNRERLHSQDDASLNTVHASKSSLSRPTVDDVVSVPPRQLWHPIVDPNKEATAKYIEALELPTAFADSSISLVECTMCNRSFTVQRIERHKEICSNLPRNRKAFDPVKMRNKDTDFAKYQNGKSEQEKKYSSPKKSNWRQQHESLVANMQYARIAATIGKTGGVVPPPPPMINPDYVKCETCGRKFNETAAERHIPFCKKSHNRKATRW